MKQLFTIALMLLLCFAGNSQVIFSEDFDGMPGPTAGGAGTYTFPNGWRLRNVDNRTPDAQVAYVNEAWERREDFATNVVDSVMFSTSYYSPVGPADDWAWTPAITLTANNVLSWNARAYDPSYPDGYEVRIMTMSSTPGGPTGGTGVLGNQLTSSTQIFSTGAESTSWTARTVNLASYAGQTVWIGFRNTSNDKFLLVIDDILVQHIVNYNAQTSNAQQYEYSEAPISIGPIYPLSAKITNTGVQPLTGVTLTADVYNSSNNLVFSQTSTATTLAPGANQTFALNNFVPTYADNYSVYYHSSISGTDEQTTDDSVTVQFVVSDSVYARDSGVATGTLGIGSGNGGYLGQQFTVNTADTLTTVSIYVTRGYANEPIAAVIWDMSGGNPNQIIAVTDTLLYPDDSARLYVLPMYSLTVLNPGEYVVTTVEFDSTMAVGLSNNIFTLNKTWVDWPTNPQTPWGNNEDYGSQYNKAYMIRANFADVCHSTYYTQDVTLCYGEELVVGTSTYGASGTYQDIIPYGYCDSVVTTNLVILDELVNTVDTVICFGESYTVGTSVYTSSGTYTDVLSNGVCDSTVTTNLVVLDELVNTVDTVICFGESYTVGTSVYTASGVYTDVLSNGVCDSTVTTNLTVLDPVDIQTGISTDLTTFTCVPVAGATYQWIDCNTNMPIVGADSSAFTTGTLMSVAVIVTDGDCSDTSSCITNTGVGLSELGEIGFYAYPNPAKDEVHIMSQELGSFVMVNELGQELLSFSLTAGYEITLNVNHLARGVYVIKNISTQKTTKIILR